MARDFEIEGMKELLNSIERLGKLPQRTVTKAAKSGATIALKAAKKGGWIDQSGELRKGIKLKGERRTKIGKKVYDVMMDPAKNNIFVKISKDGKRAYYPASQEYGFITKDGRYVPGFHFLRNSLTEHARSIEETIVNVLSEEIDKELGKG